MRAQDRQNHAEMQKEKVEWSGMSCACVLQYSSSRGDGD